MRADPYKYFRVEARELLEVLSRGALELERGSGGLELIGGLLRAAHTLKGASRVVKQTAIADLAHAIEDALASHRDGQHPVPPAQARQVLALVDAITHRVVSLEPPAAPAPQAASPPVVEERFQTVRVETGELDRVLTGVMQAGVQLAAMRREIEPLDDAHTLIRELVEQWSEPRANGDAAPVRPRRVAVQLQTLLDRQRRAAGIALDQADREIAQVRDAVNALRLLPASVLFGPLERVIRDGAQSLQKRMDFHAAGGENRLDAHVLAALQDALLHVVRNAVAHGIESEALRVARGKTPVGRVELRVARAGTRIVFSCADDGGGIDVEAVRRAAARDRRLPATEVAALESEQVIQLMLEGGMSTTITPTGMSGRGIGLDVVRETMARLHGEVAVRTRPGQGTTFELSVPVSLSSVPALRVEAGGVTCGIPVDAVRAALRVPAGAIARSADGASITHGGMAVPFIPLAGALGKAVSGGLDRSWSAAVIQAGGRTAAVGVDRMLGTTTVLLKPIPAWVGARPVIAGAALDASGDPWLVLEPVALAASEGREWRALEASPPRPAPILVVDDSLTTRMLEQSILESAGYEVEVATSGEEALQKSHDRRYSLLIVDIEMPGMDGFEVIARAQALPALRDVPAILVTSRSSPEDRRRGDEVGARAYIVKNDFDQNHLLSVIRRLIG
jgi:two-component system chemotaxis sensor kinase CheA